MDMEMSSGAVPKLEHPPAREARRCRVLLVAGLVALPLLAFFVVGQESATTVWEMASAKFTGAMNDAAGNATSGRADELLGGLLAPGMRRRSCWSRYETWRYYKHFPYAPSPAGLGMAVIIWICTAPRANSSAIYPVSSSPLLELPSTPNSPPLLNERKIHLAHDLLGAPETHLIRSRVESIAGAPSSRSSSSSARPCTETGTLPLSQVFRAFMA